MSPSRPGDIFDPMTDRTLGIVHLALAAVAVVVSFVVMSLFGAAVEPVAKAAVGLIQAYLGSAAVVAFPVVLFMLVWWIDWRVKRRYEAAQFAADRTIHVDPPKPRGYYWKRVAWFISPFVIGTMITLLGR